MKPHPLTYLEWRILRYLARADCDGDYEDQRWFHFASDGLHFASDGLHFASDGLHFAYCNRGVVLAPGTKAGHKLIETPYVEAKTDEYRTSYHLTEAGRKIAMGSAPAFKVPKLPPLRAIEMEVLDSLCYNPEAWHTPLHLGGRNGSQHSEAAYRLTLHGLAEMSKNGGEAVTGTDAYPTPTLWKRGKGSRRFRVTAKGIARNEAARVRIRAAGESQPK